MRQWLVSLGLYFMPFLSYSEYIHSTVDFKNSLKDSGYKVSYGQVFNESISYVEKKILFLQYADIADKLAGYIESIVSLTRDKEGTLKQMDLDGNKTINEAEYIEFMLWNEGRLEKLIKAYNENYDATLK